MLDHHARATKLLDDVDAAREASLSCFRTASRTGDPADAQRLWEANARLEAALDAHLRFSGAR
jgi:hypothetical protein